MKARTDDYHDCLIVWETVWTATALEKIKRRDSLTPKSISPKTSIPKDVTPKVSPNGDVPSMSSEPSTVHKQADKSPETELNKNGAVNGKSEERNGSPSEIDDSSHFANKSTCVKLNDTEMFTLCLCLSIIRRERDLIFANDFDACEILKVSFLVVLLKIQCFSLQHFNTLNLNDDLNNILLHALNIWFWIKNDGGEEQLHLEEEVIPETEKGIEAAEDFDLLNDDFMLISTLNV